MNGRSVAKWLFVGAVAFVYVVVIPLAFGRSQYVLSVITTASVLSVISLGVWLTFAIGRINIGQGAFALLGGYACAVMTTRLGLSFWLALPLAGLLAALVGTIVGWPILRLRGVYFAMLTLSLTEAVRLAAINGGAVTNGAAGIVNVPPPGELALFGVVLIPAFDTVNGYVASYYLGAALLILALGAVWRIANSRLGWIFRSLQQDEDLALSIGINVARYRVVAYAICCFLGGIGGAFFTVAQRSIYPTSFGVPDSIYFMLYCFLGGLASVFGPVVGAFILFLGFEVLHGLREYQMLIYAVIIIGLILWLPNGLLSLRPPGRLAPVIPGHRLAGGGRRAGRGDARAAGGAP